MSHISRIKTQMVEREFLIKAIEDLGYTWEEGDLKLNGFSEAARVEIKIPVRLSNDIGFRKTEHGYDIIADWWGVRKINQKEFTDKLTQRYAYHATCARLAEQGFTLVNEQSQPGGEIRLVLRRLN
jgi:hypothetical protein